MVRCRSGVGSQEVLSADSRNRESIRSEAGPHQRGDRLREEMNADQDIEELLARLHKEEKDIQADIEAEADWERAQPLSAATVVMPATSFAVRWNTLLLIVTLLSLPFTPFDVAFSVSARSRTARM